MARVRPVDPAAYDAYLQGEENLDWKKESTEKAIIYFQQAIAKDPNLALAYVGLADAHIYEVDNGFEDPSEGYPKVEEATNKALAIDSRLGEAHRTLAAVKEHRWDWAGAEREYQLAIQFNPGSARAHHFYGTLLSPLGRQNEAIAELRRAVELDPSGLFYRVVLADVYYTARQYENAVKEYEKTIALDPNFSPAHQGLGTTLVQMGRRTEAIAEFERAQATSPDAGAVDAWLAYAHASAGKKTEALDILQRMKESSKSRFVPPIQFALVYTGLGEKEQAFRWLETAFAKRDTHLESLNVDPIWDPLRSDPRFQNLVRRVGLVR